MNSTTWIIVGCGRQKAKNTRKAEELYTGSLCRSRITYAKQSRKPWLILSAKHKLLAPETWIAPYDLKLEELDATDLCKWRADVVAQLAALLAPYQTPPQLTFEIHAGIYYRQAVMPLLAQLGFNITEPTAGMGIFDQLKWYKRAAKAYWKSYDGRMER